MQKGSCLLFRVVRGKKKTSYLKLKINSLTDKTINKPKKKKTGNKSYKQDIWKKAVLFRQFLAMVKRKKKSIVHGAKNKLIDGRKKLNQKQGTKTVKKRYRMKGSIMLFRES